MLSDVMDVTPGFQVFYKTEKALRDFAKRLKGYESNEVDVKAGSRELTEISMIIDQQEFPFPSDQRDIISEIKSLIKREPTSVNLKKLQMANKSLGTLFGITK